MKHGFNKCNCLVCSQHWFLLVMLFSPELAETTSFSVQEGDVIVLGTDGLFDNMKDDMIIKHIARLKVNYPRLCSFF